MLKINLKENETVIVMDKLTKKGLFEIKINKISEKTVKIGINTLDTTMDSYRSKIYARIQAEERIVE